MLSEAPVNDLIIKVEVTTLVDNLAKFTQDIEAIRDICDGLSDFVELDFSYTRFNRAFEVSLSWFAEFAPLLAQEVNRQDFIFTWARRIECFL